MAARDVPHSEALRGVCEYAMSLPERMPNFICDQQTSRYRGDGKVPRDLITALVRYEDGNVSYTEIKLNGKAARAIADWPVSLHGRIRQQSPRNFRSAQPGCI